MQMTVILPDQRVITVTSGTTKKTDGTAITPDTLFQIGSDTKSFTAALMLKLQEEGRISLNDKVGDYLPEYPQWKDITITQLLHNNSGIYNYSEDKAFQKSLDTRPGYQWTPKELVAIAAKHPADFKPGEGWHYSNTNFILAGMIAEKVTLKHLAKLYDDYFLQSDLKLADTYYMPFPYSSAILQRFAHGYDDDNKDITQVNMSWAGAAGAMISNSYDLAEWSYAIFHNKALSDESMKEMMQLVSTKTGKPTSQEQEGYGMGLGMRTSPKYGIWWGHEGETLGYHAIFIWFPSQRITAAILTNGSAAKLRDTAMNLPSVIN
jgi:D-alanyl-D-alanine carboxypeptidase